MPSPEPGSHWGILGGTFDPVHLGHINLASQIRGKRHLNGIIIVPSYQHPFKKTEITVAFEKRCQMLEHAFPDISYIISTIEKDKALSGYTIDSIRALKSDYPNVEFSYIIGYDILAEFNKWHQHEQIINETNILVGKRESDEIVEKQFQKSDKIYFVDTDIVNAASTEIRQKLKEGMNLKEMQKYLSAAVAEYIMKENLYR